MKATDVLREEHEGIRLMLKILGEVCGRLGAGSHVELVHLEGMMEFFKVFVDRCHHGKEEDLLFPSMQEQGVVREGGPIGVMLMEHDQGRGYVRRMSDALSSHKAGEEGAVEAFIQSSRGYAALLDVHIEKENNVLFPMADMRLSTAKQNDLIQAFERLEVERIGPGKHEELHKLLERLKGVYLN